jgi:hypothetical protein
LDSAAPDSSGGGAVALFHEIPENRHEEGGGADVETLVKDWRAMPGWFLSLRSLAIWFNDARPVATELSRDWRNPAAVNLRELRMINRVWLAMRSRSGRLGHERPAGKAFDIPSLLARSPCQAFFLIIFI